MGYACPVCEEVQLDGEHLANHLAFTAILRGGAHEEWLDNQVPEWHELGPPELGSEVAAHAEEVKMDIPDDESVPQPDHFQQPSRPAPSRDRLSAEDRAILEEARDLTRRMYEGDSPGEDSWAENHPEKHSNEDSGAENHAGEQPKEHPGEDIDSEDGRTGAEDAEQP